jgi:hypothetical protein
MNAAVYLPVISIVQGMLLVDLYRVKQSDSLQHRDENAPTQYVALDRRNE